MPTGKEMARALAEGKAMRAQDAEAKQRRIQKAAEDIVDETVLSIDELVRERRLPRGPLAEAVKAERERRTKGGA